MNLKYILILVFACCFVLPAEAQRTTSVKGYYRKDGTYVRPHKRSVGTSSKRYSYKRSSSSYSSSLNASDTPNIIVSDLTVSKPLEGNYASVVSKYSRRNKKKILPTDLKGVKRNDSVFKKGFVIYASVLRYKGKVIDISPIAKEKYGSKEWDFREIYHRFPKDSISDSDALDLISNYSWDVRGDYLKKDFRYSSLYNNKLPDFLVRTVEAIQLN